MPNEFLKYAKSYIGANEKEREKLKEELLRNGWPEDLIDKYL